MEQLTTKKEVTYKRHHNKYVENIADVLSTILRVEDKSFFRVFSAFFLSKIASNMRAVVKSKDRNEVVLNMYAIALAPSGYGKGRSLGILEDQIMGGFISAFNRDIIDVIAEKNIVRLASQRSVISGTSYDEEYEALHKEYKDCGEFMFTASEGTAPAVKQYRHKLLLANIGAINFIIDEIGSNIDSVVDILDVGLELYDQGKVKDKMVKNTAESKRMKPISGKTPTNILMFGTPSKLFDGSRIENTFNEYLTAGYARRSLFSFSDIEDTFDSSITPEEIFKKVVDADVLDKMDDLNDYFASLANELYVNSVINVPDDVSIELIAYQLDCEKRASQLSRFDENSRAELKHRYFRVLKLAGVFAFIDKRSEVSSFDLQEAIALVEESGEAFARIMDRDKPYMTLAKYIAESKVDLTHADLSENLPFYPKGVGQRNEYMMLAKAWGFKEGILIKTNVIEGVEFISGESLTPTDLNAIRISASRQPNADYTSFEAPFTELHNIVNQDGAYWVNHLLERGNALEKECVEGFNFLTFEVAEATFPKVNFIDLFKEYTFLLKEVSNEIYQVIIPINYTLGLSQEEYKQFIESVLLWLPFKPKVVFQERLTRKVGNVGQHYYNEGKLVDVIPFVPNTSKNDTFKENITNFSSNNYIERWFANKITVGNKYDTLLDYAIYLAKNGEPFSDMVRKVKSFNDTTIHPITEIDIDTHLINHVRTQYYI